MKKLLSSLVLAALMLAPLPSLAATQQPVAQRLGFDYEWVSQSPNPTLRPGDTAILWVKVKNTGSVAWNNQIRLGTSHEQDRTSQFANTDSRSRWIGNNRIKLENDNTTEVGATTGFGFYITVPSDMPGGTYREYFQPVYDGVGWMKDIGIYWDITVSGNAPVNNIDVEKSVTGTVGETVSFTYDFLSGDRTPSAAAAEFSYDTESLDLIEHLYDPTSSNPPNTIINNVGTAPSGAIVQWKEKFSFRIKKPGSHIVEIYRLGAQHKDDPAYANYTSHIEIRGISQQGVCAQVITSAENPATGEIREFPTPCDVPAGWEERFGQFGAPRPAATWSTFIRDYDYELVDQSFAKSSYQEGEEDILVVRLKNTGRAPWYNYGPHAVYLGTSHPQDTLSKAISLGYLGDTNRVMFVPNNAPNQFRLESDGYVSGLLGNVLSDIVNPGQIARFEIPIAAPEVASDLTYREHFQPVLEGIGWMKDIGLYWDISVVNSSGTIAPPEEDGSDQLTEDDIDISFFRFITIQSDKTHVTPGGSATISWGINPFFASLLEPAELQTLRNHLANNVSCTIDGSTGGTAFEGSFVVSNITSDRVYNMSCYDRKKDISYQTSPDTASSAVVVVVSSLPAKPYAVTATPQSNGDVLIRWQNSNTITPYSSAFTITYSSDPTFREGLVGFNILPGGDQTEYTISRDRLEPNTTYYVVVQFNGPVDGYDYVPSPNSDMVSFRTGSF